MRVAYNPGNGNMYVTNVFSGTVSVIDQNNEVVDTVTVGITPQGIAYNPGNGNMYGQTSSQIRSLLLERYHQHLKAYLAQVTT